jgi:tetratricopeptide (TPR) repeat protein
LQTIVGNPDIAIQGLEKHHFHASEISDINYHDAWVDAHVLKGIQLKAEGKPDEAIAHFNKAMEYPLNLESTRDSKIGIAIYLIAQTYRKQKNETQARDFYQQTIAFEMPHGWGAGSAPEVAYCKAMALRKTGKLYESEEYIKGLLKEANEIFTAKPNNAEYTNSVKLRLHRRQSLAKANYMMALARMAGGNIQQANSYIREVLKLEPSHFGAKYFSLLTHED